MAAVKLSRYRKPVAVSVPIRPLAKIAAQVARVNPRDYERRQRWLVEYERRLTCVRPELTGKVDYAAAVRFFQAGVPLGLAVSRALADLLKAVSKSK